MSNRYKINKEEETIGNIKVLSVEEYLNLSKTFVTDELLVKEVVSSIEFLFSVKFDDIIANHSKESVFIKYCLLKFLMYDKDIVPKTIMPIFKGYYTKTSELTSYTLANKSTSYIVRYNHIREQLHRRINELFN
jgi:hypothetical protein